MTYESVIQTIETELRAKADIVYRDFQTKLMPTVDKETVLGVRTPILRQMAKTYRNTALGTVFRDEVPLPHRYYEANNLHAFLIEQITDYDACIAALNRFLPYVDNWATCDSMMPKVLLRYPVRLRTQIDAWLSDEKPYTVRYGIGMAMRAFLDDRFDHTLMQKIARIKREEYYIRMMQAWYFATALAKQYDTTLPFLREHCLPLWVHNKTVQKALESYRITDDKKTELRKLKQK